MIWWATIKLFFGKTISKLFSNIWYIITAILVGVIIFLYIGLHIRDSKISNLTNELNTTKIMLANIKLELSNNKKEYYTKLNIYKTKSPKVITKYTTIYKEIEDSNATLKDKVFNYVKRMRDEELNITSVN